MKKGLKEQTISKLKAKGKNMLKTSMEKEPCNIKKQYLKSRQTCKVTFCLPKEAAPGAKNVTVVGDFNDWSHDNTPMKRQRNGNFKVSIELNKNKDYHFRYLIDGSRWENDWCADKYSPNPYGCDDSVLVI
jgi:1,4-alpha-glucan branching enzyme